MKGRREGRGMVNSSERGSEVRKNVVVSVNVSEKFGHGTKRNQLTEH